MGAALPPLSLYIHFPWCVSKCPYCDFNSHTGYTEEIEQTYIQALLDDLDQQEKWFHDRPIQSIFFGGGTPSLCSVRGMNRLLEALQNRLDLASDCEVTLEANPNSAEAGKFSAFVEAGINRLSIGIQSFNPIHLQRLGRAHSREEALKAVESAHRANPGSINLDLMFALPDQTLEQALDDLQTAINLQPQHLSHYQLTLEPGTPFYHQPPTLPDDTISWDMQQACGMMLDEKGYRQYEVSAYSQEGFRCRHNLNYWQFGDYLGIGAGAHSKLTDMNGQIWRQQRHRMPRSYILAIQNNELEENRRIETSDLPFEFMLNALRLVEGVESRLFEQTTGLPLKSIQSQLKSLQQRELLEEHASKISPTARGRQFLNEAIMQFMP
ncbi:MAG: radical SAM family heme chaperone HemW [Gammaproteobacteria bacterium]|nr:MAG: radical SAM family heme chaperone HemW [Gammaproteobacteria bacterium]